MLLEKQTDEMKVDWILENLLAPGQRLAYLWNNTSGQKQAFGLKDLVEDNAYIRGLLLAHVKGAPATAECRYIKKGTCFAKSVPACKLGVYYGGDADINAVVNYALDCDVSQYLSDLKAGLPPDEGKGEGWKAFVPPGELEKEAERLTEMMKAAMEAFPNCQFFQKANGKWHAHGRMNAPRPAAAVKKHLRSRLPACCVHIEVFPKVDKLTLPDDKWFNASYVRLPLSPDMQYIPVNGLTDIVLDDVENIPILEPVAKETKIDNHLPSVTTLPDESRIQAVRNYAAKIGDVSEGHRHRETFKVAACALKDNALPWNVAFELIKEFNHEHCKPPLDETELPKQVNDAGAYGSNETRKLSPGKTAPEIRQAPIRPAYIPPTSAEIKAAISGTPLETYGRELRKISEKLPQEMILADSLLVAGMILAKREVRLGTHVDDYSPIWTNMYVMKLAESGGGKGRTSQYVMKAMTKHFNLAVLAGESESAIIGCAEERGAYGIYYKDEIKKIIDPDSCTARQIVNTLLGAWDNGRLEYVTRPKGELKMAGCNPAYPSALIDGQPNIIESTCGRSNVDAGFAARFLIATSNGRGRIVTRGYPDGGNIARAYQVYDDARPGMILYPIYNPPSRGDAYQEHMTAGELAAWGRLAGQYIPKIALILDPSALKTGMVQTAALDKAAIIADLFFANAIKFLGLIHEDKHEARRVRAHRYVLEHHGCTMRELYRAIRCSASEMQRDILPTLVARGDIVVDWKNETITVPQAVLNA